MGLFDKIKKVWSQDMAIDLGTANTLVASANAYLNALNKMLIKREKKSMNESIKHQKVKGI